jgi:hypothetical protein
VHATTKSWWLDIEESAQGTLWSSDTTANVAVLKGWVHTLRKAGKNVGVYSTGGYWWMITNNWRTRLPQWVAVGLGGIDRAREACARPFTDGPVVMTQWLTGPYDGNLLCTKAQRKKLTTGWHGGWFRAHTAGVPSLLTIPVPHPEIEALLKAEKQADKDAAKAAKKARKAKAKAAHKAQAKATHHAKPKPQPKPQPKPKPKPQPKPKPKPSRSRSPRRSHADADSHPTPTPTPNATPDPDGPTGAPLTD